MDTTVNTASKPNIVKLADRINSAKNPQAYAELLAAMIKYANTIRQTRQPPEGTPAPAPQKALKDVAPVIDEIHTYIERSHLPETKSRYDMNWTQLSALHTVSNKDVAGALVYAFSYGRAKGYRMGRAEHKGRKGG